MSNKLKVGKDGRIAVPKRIVQDAGLSPHDEIDAEDLSVSRRGFLGRAAVRMRDEVATVAAVLAIGEWIQHRNEHHNQMLQDLLESVIGIGRGGSGALLAAANHPFKPPADNGICYPNHLVCCRAYVKRFLRPGGSVRPVRGAPQVRSDDSLVLFGSQVSNLSAQSLFGNPFDGREHFDIEAKGLASGWRSKLHWNVSSPSNARPLKLTQFESEWITSEHVIVDSDSGHTTKPRTRGYVLQEDYLLLTVLPRFNGGTQRIVAFSGLHSPAVDATQSFFNDPPVEVLQELEKQTRDEPYYQALFHVDVKEAKPGELKPGRLTLVEARPLDVQFG